MNSNEKQKEPKTKYYIAGIVERGCQFMEAIACGNKAITTFRTARDDLAYYGKSSRRLFVVEVPYWEYQQTYERFQKGEKHFVCLAEENTTVDELFERYPVDSEVLEDAYKTIVMRDEA